jgi:hypothetical protein
MLSSRQAQVADVVCHGLQLSQHHTVIVQASERRMRRLEKQLATLSAALGPAAAAALESMETSSAASGAGAEL